MDKHTIAKTKEMIALADGFLICGENMFSACHSAHKHDQGGFRQVEVCNQCVHHPDFLAGIDENIRPAGVGRERKSVLSDRF